MLPFFWQKKAGRHSVGKARTDRKKGNIVYGLYARKLHDYTKNPDSRQDYKGESEEGQRIP